MTLGSAGLYDLDTRYIPDVLGLRATGWPEAEVVKVMSRRDNRCVRVLIPDENVGHKGFHDVLLHDMADTDTLYVAVSDLSALHQDWPAVVISRMIPWNPGWVMYLLWKSNQAGLGQTCLMVYYIIYGRVCRRTA